jgi:hypothetical protein
VVYRADLQTEDDRKGSPFKKLDSSTEVIFKKKVLDNIKKERMAKIDKTTR